MKKIIILSCAIVSLVAFSSAAPATNATVLNGQLTLGHSANVISPSENEECEVIEEDYTLKCWALGKATKRALKASTELTRKQIRQIRNIVVEFCNEVENQE